MHELILWAGFGGAWLLVVGPLYQAVLELNEEDTELDRLRHRLSTVPRLEPPSRWWWMLPPVGWLLRHRHRQQVRRTLLDSLDDIELAALTTYVNKARGWMYVGTGGLLIAVKETWELAEGLDWAVWTFWSLILLMTLVAVANSAFTARHRLRSPSEPPTGLSA